jgi:hypothetical protein
MAEMGQPLTKTAAGADPEPRPVYTQKGTRSRGRDLRAALSRRCNIMVLDHFTDAGAQRGWGWETASAANSTYATGRIERGSCSF